ncbi:UNKNOWN [Stylonychia lemnae]|uniref:Uncharacterized protein n=1 Tax=Stylonychia lemnae TaxID=5949 RepID=A0A078AIW0_STYLE|nr:UNKNOWN [Stylonychia lemnae]|eukprot:CDW80743.1 UNKNOWN [Stylonychia lemnae]
MIVAVSLAAQTELKVRDPSRIVAIVPQVKVDIFQRMINWYQNIWFFMMRSIYDLYCFQIGWTYVILFNDGGANFYKCYYSVPYRIDWLTLFIASLIVGILDQVIGQPDLQRITGMDVGNQKIHQSERISINVRIQTFIERLTTIIEQEDIENSFIEAVGDCHKSNQQILGIRKPSIKIELLVKQLEFLIICYLNTCLCLNQES